MDTKKIKALLLAIEKRSMSQASLELSYTPSALSHMADALENELGVKILARNQSGISLTSDGETLYPKLKALLECENEIIESARKIREKSKFELRIASYASVSKGILPEIIKDFKKKNPEIKVSITVCDNVLELLDSMCADVAFASDVALKDRSMGVIATDPYVAIVEKTMFQGRHSVKKEELYSYAYIPARHLALSKYFDLSKFRELLSIDTPDEASIISMVREGLAISVLPATNVKGDKKGIRALRLDPPVARKIVFAHNLHLKSKEESYSTEKFIEFLNKYSEAN